MWFPSLLMTTIGGQYAFNSVMPNTFIVCFIKYLTYQIIVFLLKKKTNLMLWKTRNRLFHSFGNWKLTKIRHFISRCNIHHLKNKRITFFRRRSSSLWLTTHLFTHSSVGTGLIRFKLTIKTSVKITPPKEGRTMKWDYFIDLSSDLIQKASKNRSRVNGSIAPFSTIFYLLQLFYWEKSL